MGPAGRAGPALTRHRPHAAGDARPSVLFLAADFAWPADSGGRQRVFHSVRGLARHHDVTVAHVDPPGEPAHVDGLRAATDCADVVHLPVHDAPWCQRPDVFDWMPPRQLVRETLGTRLPAFVRFHWSPTLVAALARLRAARRFDAVWTRHASYGEQARAAGFARVVVDADDLLSLVARQRLRAAPRSRSRPFHAMDAVKAHLYERRLPSRFARLVVAKPEDHAFFPPARRDRVQLIPNGVRLPAAVPPAGGEGDVLLFVGLLPYWPNVQAITFLAREVLPRVRAARPGVVLEVVGRGPCPASLRALLDEAGARLHVGPPDLAPFYARAGVVTAPVFMGGGTRIKVLEALAYGRALVATPFAPEGLGLRDGTHLVLADGADAFAEACVALLADPARRARLGAAGRAHVAARFDWDDIEARVAEVMAGVLAEGGR